MHHIVVIILQQSTLLFTLLFTQNMFPGSEVKMSSFRRFVSVLGSGRGGRREHMYPGKRGMWWVDLHLLTGGVNK